MTKARAYRFLTRPWVAPFSVGLLAAGLFAPSLGFDLVWDDPGLLRNVQRLVAQGGLGELLSAPFRIDANVATGYWRPWTYVSLWFDSLWGAGRPFAFHLTNVLLHAACSVLVFRLLARLGLGTTGAWLGGLAFAAHPVHVDSVAFVSGRTDVWALLFCLLGVEAWSRARHERGRRAILFGLLSLVAYFLALGAKEVALMLPSVLLAWSVLEALSERPRQLAPRLRSLLPWIVGWGAVVGLNLLARGGIYSEPIVVGPSESLEPWDALRRLEASLAYLRLLVLPWPLRPYYTAAEISLTVINGAAAGLLAALAGWLLWRRDSRRFALLGLLWIVGFLVPVLGWVPVRAAVIAERFLYLPSVGLSVLVAACANGSLGARRLTGTVSLAAVFGLAVATTVRLPVWRDDVTLFTDAISRAPGFVHGYCNLGSALHTHDRLEEAVPVLRRGLQVAPDLAYCHTTLGRTLAKLGRPREALASFRTASELEPTVGMHWHDLGICLRDLGQPEPSVDAFVRAIELDPSLFDARLNLGQAYLTLGQFDRARSAYERAVELDASSGEGLAGLAVSSAALGDRARATDLLRRLEALNPALASAAAASVGRLSPPSPPLPP